MKSDPGPTRHLDWHILVAFVAAAVTLLSGLVAALVYSRHEPVLRSWGVTLQHLRPIHETYAFAWVFLGGVAVVYFYLHNNFGPLTRAAGRRVGWQLALWVVAGAGILISLVLGQFSGREYLGYHPAFSLLILCGWFLFAWNYFERVGMRLVGKPVYIYMWSVAIPLFVVAFLEAHLFLLDFVSDKPVRDIAIQWKSNGVLVGSFNLLAYGALMYIVGLVRSDDGYAYSRTAFALFCVGVLNTFTNYGHHTYHLPQSPWIHWISFVVSMLEFVILAKLFWDILALRRTQPRSDDLRVCDGFVRSASLWTCTMLALSLLIAVPPLNALIHGTHVVVAHSMGSMLGVNTMILLAAMAYMVQSLCGTAEPSAVRDTRVRLAIPVLNLSLALFWLAFLGRGLASGWTRYAGPSSPDFSPVLQLFPRVVLISGIGLTFSLLWILGNWAAVLVAHAGRRRRTELGGVARAADK